MKILYGVQGTGNGHITRARIMAKTLARQGARVDWVFSGRPPENYFDMELFGDYRCFSGLTLVTRKGRVLPFKTLTQNHFARLHWDIRQLDLSGYDLIINDFEPVSAWAARRAGKPVLGISHQCAFLHAIPRRGDNVLTRAFMRYFAPVDRAIGLHWYHFDQPILPPLVEASDFPNESRPGHYLVYLPFGEAADILPQLSHFPEHHFYLYQAVPKPEDRGHIHIRPFSRQGFQADLHRCEGVICSAGFELPSEAIQLGKKLLVQPVRGQMEQESNALALSELGYGAVTPYLTVDAIGQWLTSPKPRPLEYPPVAEALARWLVQDGADAETFDSMCAQLWHALSAPNETANCQGGALAGFEP